MGVGQMSKVKAFQATRPEIRPDARHDHKHDPFSGGMGVSGHDVQLFGTACYISAKAWLKTYHSGFGTS